MSFVIKLTNTHIPYTKIDLYFEDFDKTIARIKNDVEMGVIMQECYLHPGSLSFTLCNSSAYGGIGKTWVLPSNILQTGGKNFLMYDGLANPAEIGSKLVDLNEITGHWSYGVGSRKRYVEFSTSTVTVYDTDGITTLYSANLAPLGSNSIACYAIPGSIPRTMTVAQFKQKCRSGGLQPYAYSSDVVPIVSTWSGGWGNGTNGWTDWLYYLLHWNDSDTDLDPSDDDPYSGDDSPYDPSEVGGGDGDNVDPYNGGDEIPVPNLPPVGMSSSGMMDIYTPSDVQLNLLAGYLWDNNFVTSLVKDMYADCMDVIISLGIVPFNITSAGTKNIKVGDRDSGISSNYPSGEYFEVDCGTLDIQTVIGSYMDYEPYTKIKLFLPYIGWVALDNDIFMAKTMGVKYHINIATGEALAFVSAGPRVIGQYSGNVLMKVPLSGANYAEMWKGVLQATVGLASCGLAGAAAGGAAAAGATEAGSASAASSQAVQAGRAAGSAINALATKPTFQFSNNMGCASGFMGVQTPYLLIERPNLCIPSNQKDFEGYPSFLTRTLSGLRGFTRVHAINLSVPSATSRERAEIKAALMNGIYIEDYPAPSGSSGNIYLYKNKSSNETVGKNLEAVGTLSGTFRDAVDVHNVTVRMNHSSPDFNYIYIPDFGRCYYVDSVTVVRTGVLDVVCSVDPLNSFKGEILANQAIIDKQANAYNLYLNDDTLKVYQNPLYSTHLFSAGFSGYEYVLLVAGG